MFKVAVIGASGLLGRAIVDELAATTGWQLAQTAFRRAGPHQTTLDVRDAQAVSRYVEHEAPDAIVIAAAERRPDVCEQNPDAARALNVDAVRSIATAARQRGAWVLSISTDYVFDGTQPPYRCDDTPNPLNAYGRSKLEGERALLDSTDAGLVLRLPLLYGPIVDWSESAVTSLVPAIAASARANAAPAMMDAWATRYPTFTPDVAFVIRELLTRYADGNPVCGIAQWSGDEPMTKYDIAQQLAGALGLNARLVPLPAPADATPRPRDCHLDASRLETLGIGRRTPFNVAIRAVLDAFPWRGDAPTAEG
ncbi:dTDP-4-dehydrorhamnose reductase family protein [Paraburkholderia caballeronis]|uniref:dTDP-4-dehydrorhamnose reductase n=1 Tax=Paraburkholderia caballeronis TaxID=416943 RepID=A0A1H7U8J8_9BURK|nr:SDR family oxidoreductase [Paraburkholderia caballeronis]PXW23332.1 dTDP-4-dehydrorhamnose reductase [Paraburkholderia caballeronis]PXW98325.1 dTDP-4-dehydrorhamnose reductase [Paraburkholderia caballeronis]RAJ95055.1 dTDP-4-dehydrorhamnose reductase [Paraburkholderia caballeronis]SEC59451.1 dTDP-4-dehydrorhamnose reductase [Paraburkholderia caballeronis]SEL93332.1 dTDP-4-dehydrorhamnose reductase [Paraburkholderia caballeronis]